MVMSVTLKKATHTYRVDGRVIEWSPSRVLTASGTIDTRYFTEQGRIDGTRRHLVKQLDSEGDLLARSVDPHDLPYLKAWRAFARETGWISTQIEKPVYSHKHDIATTPDDIGFFPRDTYLTALDIKTGVVGTWTKLQTAAHVMIYNDHHADAIIDGAKRVVGRCALRLNCHGTYAYLSYRVANLRRDMDEFIGLLEQVRAK